MCGITGIYTWRENKSEDLAPCVDMVSRLNHRGPDNNGVWSDTQEGLALGHARLSIIDLSHAGHQPMLSADRRWIIAYNGEVYNAREMRNDLEKRGVIFHGSSDTEVILESIADIGVESTVKQLIGMFAFVVWDRQHKRLYLVRDRLGIKPLYWGHFGGLFLFGSELKAMRAHPACSSVINRDAMANFFRHNYIPGPATIYKDVFKLMPGTILSISEGGDPCLETYWSLDDVVKQGGTNLHVDNEQQAVAKLDELLRDAVGRRMVSDVPLGAFLSGGIDSSTVVALMQAQSDQAINTFSIGFNEDGFNEAQHAARVARHLGTHHTELYVSPKDAMDVIPNLSSMFDEPFADSSQIPTYLVSAMTRKHVTVALSGDGGDECFAGYTRYILAERIRRIQQLLPMPIRNMLATAIYSVSPARFDRLARILPTSIKPFQFGHRMHKLAGVLLEVEDDFYRRLISHWPEPERLLTTGQEQMGIVWDSTTRDRIPVFVDRMRYYDMLTYLPDDILTKVDRASMAVSLEARVPLLDHRVVEFSWSLPMHYKIRKGEGKWLLRQVLDKYVPRSLMERPKMGFGVPIDHWLRGPLRDWAEELLNERSIRQAGYLNPIPIRKKWEEHLSGTHNWQYLIWDVLMFQCWYEKWG